MTQAIPNLSRSTSLVAVQAMRAMRMLFWYRADLGRHSRARFAVSLATLRWRRMQAKTCPGSACSHQKMPSQTVRSGCTEQQRLHPRPPFPPQLREQRWGRRGQWQTQRRGQPLAAQTSRTMVQQCKPSRCISATEASAHAVWFPKNRWSFDSWYRLTPVAWSIKLAYLEWHQKWKGVDSSILHVSA